MFRRMAKAALIGRLDVCQGSKTYANRHKTDARAESNRNKHPNDADFKIYAQDDYTACKPLL